MAVNIPTTKPPNQPPEQYCGNCEYWDPNPIPTQGRGYCRRRPPSMPPPSVRGGDVLTWTWPVTAQPDWCGEWAGELTVNALPA